MSDETPESNAQPANDRLIPFLIEQTGVHGRVVRMSTALDAILTAHRYPEMLSRLLGELVVIVALLGNNLKRHGILTAQIRGSGPVTMVVADITREGHIRGYAEADTEALMALATLHGEDATLDLSTLCGQGYLAITLDGTTPEDRYQGIVELQGATLADAIMHYLEHSEQVKASLKVALGKRLQDDSERWCAGAMMVQQLPEGKKPETLQDNVVMLQPAAENAQRAAEDREDWQRSHVLMETVQATELLDAALPVKTLLFRLFHEDGVVVFPERPLKQQCRCSRRRMEQVIASLPEAELEELYEQGKIRLTCRFCNTEAAFGPQEVAALREVPSV